MGWCEVHWLRHDRVRPEHLDVLDERERARAREYAREEDRARFAAGAVLVRAVAARHAGVAPERVVIERTCARCGAQHGPPTLVGFELAVSVSHSGDLVAVAASTAGPVGVDVEQVRPIDYEPLLADVCTPEERGAIDGLEAFYGVWTRKESVLKARGVGLTVPMTRAATAAPLQTVALALAPGYAAAVTVITTTPLEISTLAAGTLLERAWSPVRGA